MVDPEIKQLAKLRSLWTTKLKPFSTPWKLEPWNLKISHWKFGDSYWKSSFWGSMLNFGGVSRMSKLNWHQLTKGNVSFKTGGLRRFCHPWKTGMDAMQIDGLLDLLFFSKVSHHFQVKKYLVLRIHSYTHSIHVWSIYLHLPSKSTKCR